jgi:hypothetical protein
MRHQRQRDHRIERICAMKGNRELLKAASAAGLTLAVIVLVPQPGPAYPPAVGILGSARNCLVCHANNGPWKDPSRVILDVLDQPTGKSLKQADGSFLISARRGEPRTVLTVIGWKVRNGDAVPYRNAWLYVDPTRVADSTTLNKFAPGWAVNLPMSCRVVGDQVAAYPGQPVTALPMTVRAGDDAPQETEIELQAMLTRGESVKGKPDQGMDGNYFEGRVRLILRQLLHRDPVIAASYVFG